MHPKRILFLHDTDLSLLRGAELTINQLTALGTKKGFLVETDLLTDFETVAQKINAANFVVVNSTSRCAFEAALLRFVIDSKIPYVKIEFDYNFCVKRTIACTVDESQRLCCNVEKFHIYRDLFAQSKLNIFQSPKHYQSHYEFYGEVVSNHLVMPPTVDVDAIQVSDEKIENVIPFFGELSFLKGGKAFIEYAAEHPEKTFEVYGANRLADEIPPNVVFKSMISNDEVLQILGKTKYFFCKPYWPEPSGRLAAEAFLSGCEIISNDRIGTFSFDFYPNDIERAKREMKETLHDFWNAIATILERQPIAIPKKKNILVHKTSGGLGDIFFCIPALYALKEVYEEVAFAVEPRLVSFFKKQLEGITVVDETTTADIEKDFERVMEFGNYPAYLDGFKLPHAIKYTIHDRVGQHAIRHYIDAVARLEKQLSVNDFSFPYFKRETNFETPYYTLHAGAGLLIKTWAVQNFATLIHKIHQQYPELQCKIIVGPGDPNPGAFLSGAANVELVTGDINEVGDVFSGALFHIGNDSGITHIADAYNLPTVGIFGPTGPGAWGNFSENHEIIWGKQGTCNLKCDYEVLKNCPDRVCLSSIKVETVLGATYKLLQKSFSDLDSEYIINPALEVELSETDCLLKIDGNEFNIHFTDEKSKANVKQLLSGDFNVEEEFQPFFDFLIEQQIILSIPNFKSIKKPRLSVA